MPKEKAAEARFWDRYIQVLKQAKVPEQQHRWYVIRVERYIAAHAALRLRLHTLDTVERYVREAGQDAALPGWRFRQMVHALQLLFTRLLKPAWANAFDWDYWLASARALEQTHPTVARHNSPMVATPPPPAVEVQGSADWRDRLIAELRRRNYKIRTEQAYVHWTQRFIGFNGNALPEQLNAAHISAYLNHLALDRQVAAGTQNLALNAIVFLYEQVLAIEVGELPGYSPARKGRHLPTVLTRDEMKQLIATIADPTFALMVRLLYGAGMRLLECLRLRVMDVDLGYSQIVVRDGKGGKDRVVPLPKKCKPLLEEQIRKVLALHQEDLAQGYGEVFLPDALARKYPNAAKELGWAAPLHPCTRSIRTSLCSTVSISVGQAFGRSPRERHSPSPLT